MSNSDIGKIAPGCEGITPKVEKPNRTGTTKTNKLLKLLNSKRGATIEQLQQASGWQSHSVRGFLSGTVRKKLGLPLVSETGTDGFKRYRTEQDGASQ